MLELALEEVRAEYDAPAALPLQQEPPPPIICCVGGRGGNRAHLERLEMGDILAPTEFQSTIARLLYNTEWAIHSNIYEVSSWLSPM